MNAVLGYSQILLRKKNLDPDTKNAIRTIDTNGKNLLTMINEVLDISKIEAGKMELNSNDFDLSEMVANLTGLLELRCRQKRLQFTVKGFSAPVLVVGDQIKLRQILVNILGNAVKFTSSGVEFIYEEDEVSQEQSSRTEDLDLVKLSIPGDFCERLKEAAQLHNITDLEKILDELSQGNGISKQMLKHLLQLTNK
jgi:signal transduction histidine kinase